MQARSQTHGDGAMNKPVKIVIGIAVFIAASLSLVFYLTAGLVDTAERFFDAVQQDNMAAARGYLSADTRSRVSEASLRQELAGMGLLKFKQASWSSRSFTGARGKLNGTVTNQSGAVIPVRLDLVKERGQWRIYSLVKSSGGLPKTIEGLRERARNGDANAQLALGVRYHDGHGVARDDVQAFKWFLKAAEQGNPRGQYDVGLSYEDGLGVERDMSQAVSWYRKAAEQGLADAQTSIGIAYTRGLGVKQDRATAVQWYRKAAGQGEPGAQYDLGRAYFDGSGVAHDDAKGLAWINKSAKQGQVMAQNYLGYLYQIGRAVDKNPAEAVKWFRKSANAGNPNAQFNLAKAYELGRGVERDGDEACFWMTLAAKSDPDARKKAEDCKAHLTPDKLAQIQSRAEKWQPSRRD